LIPAAYIQEWSTRAPWPTSQQIEQDLIISRALCDLFNAPAIQGKIAFRGGTAIHKLLFQQPLRYSEDIDLVQTEAEPIGATATAVQDALSWLGKCKRERASHSMRFIYRFTPEAQPEAALKLKIEINTREHGSLFGLQPYPFEVANGWFRATANILSFSPEELFGTKLRALLQRRKNRDLFDLYVALQQLSLCPGKLIDSFEHYRVSLDTGAASRLTDGNAWEEYSPTFSADGKQIAFVRQQEDGSTSRIFLMNSDGSNLHPLFSSDSSRDSAPHFTGTHILFARIAEQVSPDPPGPAPWDVYMASVDGGPAVPLTTRHYSTHSGPSFSDDASRFLYSMGGLSPEALYVIPLNAPPQTPEPLLFQIPNGATSRIYVSPSLAPDGKSVVFLAAVQGKKAFDYDAFRLDLESNRITQLTTDNGYASDLAISPDGNWAVFLRWTSRWGSLPTMSRMYLLNLHTGGVAPLPITGTR